MQKKWIVAAAIAVVLQVGCAHAQQSSGTPEVTRTGNGMTVRRPPAPFHTGISHSVSPMVRPDGSVWAAEPPVISEVTPGSPAALVGLQPGDVVLQVNGRDAREPGLLRVREAGQEFVLRIRRGTELRDVTVVAVPNPAAAQR